MNITTKIEAARGCGYRKPGGIYIICDGPFSVCGKLPHEVGICECCGEGIRPSRAPRWINPALMFKSVECALKPSSGRECLCYANSLPDKALLIWIGEKFYPSSNEYMIEACEMGISRRISMVPRGFEVGETMVMLAHKEGKETGGVIFTAFIPDRIEYVVAPGDSEEKLQSIENRGLTLVNVVHKDEDSETESEEDEENGEE